MTKLFITISMPASGFWSTLPHPIIGLSPMDGVTDAACRYMTATLGHPAVMMTEFTAVDGLFAGADRLMQDFYYNPLERPVVAQLFGGNPDTFFQAAVICSALGFDGIDINMGCPSKNITEKGAGAALIREPERAQAIVRETQAGAEAWGAGISLEEAGVHPRLIPLIEERRRELSLPNARSVLPVSVKTRIGYDTITIDEWIPHLIAVEPIVITIHGRTLKQLYTGEANWEAIAVGAKLAHEAGILCLGNGDVTSLEDGLVRMKTAGTDGFLIGRHAIGNPWIFSDHSATSQERHDAALAHARYLYSIFGNQGFVRIRKHLLEYTKGCAGAKEIRMNLSKIMTLEDVERVLANVAW